MRPYPWPPWSPRRRRSAAAARLPAAVLSATLVVPLLLAGCGGLSVDSRPPPVVIAADLPLTGADAERGRVFRQALELRVEQLNDQGLLGGRELRLSIRDNRSDLAVSAGQLAELAADPSVTAIVAGGCAGCVIQAAPELDAAGVPTIALAPGEAVAAPVAQRRYVFQLAPDAGADADLLATELARADLDRIALVTVDDGGGYAEDGADELPAAVTAAGLELVLRDRLPAGAGNDAVAALAERVAGWRPEAAVPGFPASPAGSATGPAAVVLWTPHEDAYRIATALRQAGWGGELLLDAMAAGPLFLPGDPGVAAALAGARLVFTETLAIDQAVAATPAKVARQSWWRDYLARYGGYDAHASFAADAVGVVVAAVNRMGTTDRSQLRDTIEATTMDGLSGPLRFTPENHSGLQPLALTVLVAGGDRWRLAS